MLLAPKKQDRFHTPAQASAGLEALSLDEPILATIPTALATAIIMYRGVPSPARTPPLEVGVDVEIAESPGRGLGLFASRRIEKGTFMMDYLGEDIPIEIIESRKSEYLLELRDVFGNPYFVDSADPDKSNAARYMNHRGTRPNVRKVKQRWPTTVLRFYAGEDIMPGDELFWDYGPDYWTGRESEVV